MGNVWMEILTLFTECLKCPQFIKHVSINQSIQPFDLYSEIPPAKNLSIVRHVP